jgi:hypothetical protein
VVDELELVSISYDFGMFSGDAGQSHRESDVAGCVTADGNDRFVEFLDLALRGSQDMNDLHNDNRGTLHGLRLRFQDYAPFRLQPKRPLVKTNFSRAGILP